MRVVKVLRNIFWGDDERLTFPTIFHLKVDPSAARKVDSWDADGAKEVAQQYFCPSKFCGTPDYNESAALHSYGLDFHCR